MKIRLLLLLLTFITIGNFAFAAFPVVSEIPVNPVAANHTVCSENRNSIAHADTIIRKTSYRNQYHKPYRNHEKEAKLSLTFGLLGILVFAPFGIAALILGIIAADRRNKYFDRAKWGIILGAITTFELILIIAIVVALAL